MLEKKRTMIAGVPAAWMEPRTGEAEDAAQTLAQTRVQRIFVVTSEGVAVGVLTVEAAWSDLERPSLRVAVTPASGGKVIAGRARVLETA
ncbi:CBS domain-containing protein [Devosia geojensis]|uniref:CBS domain-containing protein n=1 Tax=Devosia geojensis TaxID=443610 RepID=UPI000698EE08|nr:CBS domain-containing protein [Devosia geojensis]